MLEPETWHGPTLQSGATNHRLAPRRVRESRPASATIAHPEHRPSTGFRPDKQQHNATSNFQRLPPGGVPETPKRPPWNPAAARWATV